MRCVRAVELLIPTQVHHGTLGPLLQRDGLAVELGGRGRHGYADDLPKVQAFVEENGAVS